MSTSYNSTRNNATLPYCDWYTSDSEERRMYRDIEAYDAYMDAVKYCEGRDI